MDIAWVEDQPGIYWSAWTGDKQLLATLATDGARYRLCTGWSSGQFPTIQDFNNLADVLTTIQSA